MNSMEVIDNMLSCTYELEGLLLAAGRLGDNTPQVVATRIQEKAQALAALADEMSSPQQTNKEAHTEVVGNQPATPHSSNPVVTDTPEASKQEPTPTAQATSTAEHSDASTVQQHQTEAQRVKQRPIADSRKSATDSPQTMRVGERLQQSKSKDLRQAMTINDRFRFRRGLFSGDDAIMNAALNHIEAMKSYGEAESYFYQYLGWNRHDVDVIDFMSMVKQHFGQPPA